MVNPISAIAPGMLRKFFEFRETPDHDRAFAEPIDPLNTLDRLDQHVPLLAERQLDHAFRRQRRAASEPSFRR